MKTIQIVTVSRVTLLNMALFLSFFKLLKHELYNTSYIQRHQMMVLHVYYYLYYYNNCISVQQH